MGKQSNYQESSSEEVSDKKKDQAAKSSPMTTRSKAGPLSRKAGPASSKRAGPTSLKRPGPMSRTKKNNSDSKSCRNTEIKSNASETETDTAIETSAELPLFSPSTKSDKNKDTALIKHSEKDAESNRHSEEFEAPSSKSQSTKLNKQSSGKTCSDEKESDKSIEDVSRLSADSPSEKYNANTCTPSAKYKEKSMIENSETEGEADLSFSALDCLPLHTPPSKPVNKTSSNNEKKEENNANVDVAEQSIKSTECDEQESNVANSKPPDDKGSEKKETIGNQETKSELEKQKARSDQINNNTIIEKQVSVEENNNTTNLHLNKKMDANEIKPAETNTNKQEQIVTSSNESSDENNQSDKLKSSITLGTEDFSNFSSLPLD